MTITVNPEWLINVEKHDIHDLPGWSRFVQQRTAYQAPPLLTRDAYTALAPSDRRSYDIARRVGNCNLPKHDTPSTIYTRTIIEAVLHSGLYSMDPGVRSGVFLSADGAMGKSTLMREIAADYDADIRQFQQLVPTAVPYRDLWVPVAWVTVPPKLSIRSLGAAILNFYGERTPKSLTDPQVTSRVEDIIRDCGTRLLVLDDITRYKDGEADRFASDWLRNLMETSVSVVAMGVDVRGSGILHDGRARTVHDRNLKTQTSRRYTVLDLEPFNYDSADGIRDWVAHLRAVEEDLLLLDKQPGMLSDELAEYLFEYTGGVIGVLADWIELSALSVMKRPASRGGETLTRADFEAIPVKDRYRSLHPEATPMKHRAARPAKRRNGSYQQPPKRGAA